MIITKSKITQFQFILMIFGIQVGIGMLSLPRELADKSGTSSWIAILFGGLISTLISILFIKLRMKAPTLNYVSFFTFYLGKVIGSIVVFLQAIYFLYAGYLVLIRSILYIQSYILQEEKVDVLLVLFLFPTYQLIKGGIHLIAKYIEAIFPIAIFTLFMLLFTLKDADINFILPIVKNGWMPIFKTIPLTTTSFLGIELILVLYPYLQSKEKAIKGVIIGNALTTFTYIFVTLICFVIYSPYEIKLTFEPVIDILSVIEFQYVERLDFILFSLFLMIISKTWVTYIWAGMNGISELFKFKLFPIVILILFILIIILTFIQVPTFTNTTNHLHNIMIYGLYITIGIPILLLIGGLIKNRLSKVKNN
ncbi:GerAB/ArcD/ProY family transporter [Gottfriedia sp. NPDC056225]|uniref:GerAB/ArcD/ProY family transporter n=1 Tax=Gottfriedia sp. NPDC056225 TaxID=3345751 RepID=UPI00155853B3|nr:GerAB/ArcD/ProY family transporter [Arthrobacter citreus]